MTFFCISFTHGVLSDLKRHTSWFPHISTPHLTTKCSSDTKYIYFKTSVPNIKHTGIDVRLGPRNDKVLIPQKKRRKNGMCECVRVKLTSLKTTKKKKKTMAKAYLIVAEAQQCSIV